MAELRWLDQVFAARRGEPVVAVLAGEPEVGKSALAVYWAHRAAPHYPGGLLFADLGGPSAPGAPAEVLGGFLRTLGEPAADVPAGGPARSARFAELSRTRRMLVVVDGVAESDDVRPLLPAGHGCAALVTSRSPLTRLVAQEAAAWLAVGPQAEQDALDLLAVAIGPGRVLAEPEMARCLVLLCGGSPPALLRAAARLAGQADRPIAGLVAQFAAAAAR
ncbi:hypothetical protein GCM10009760_29830 [Kitasatospora kazusensis]|uniref:NB-ARC domain-containing protein n=1 Tax=Kitasatospora kazusensis TaxID=407974 RepID=A0ABP5L8R0_9ACTN